MASGHFARWRRRFSPLVGGRVLAVVDGQVEVADVDERVAPVLLGLDEGGARPVLERGQMGLVVRVGERWAPEARHAGPDAGVGEILHLAVVVVQSGVLTGLGHHQVAHRAQPGVHGGRG